MSDTVAAAAVMAAVAKLRGYRLRPMGGLRFRIVRPDGDDVIELVSKDEAAADVLRGQWAGSIDETVVHICFEIGEVAAMICGAVAPLGVESPVDFVGTGGGVLTDGSMRTAAEQAASVNCQACLDCFVGTNRRAGVPS